MFLGTDLVHLFNLSQADMSGDLPPFWNLIAMAKKQQQLTVLQRAVDDTFLSLGIHYPKVASFMLLHIAVALSIRLKEKDDLSRSLHPFGLDQHASTVRKAIHTYGEQYNFVPDGKGTTVADKLNIRVPSGVSIPTKPRMEQGSLSLT